MRTGTTDDRDMGRGEGQKIHWNLKDYIILITTMYEPGGCLFAINCVGSNILCL